MILIGGTNPIRNRKNNLQLLIKRIYFTQTAMATDLKGTGLSQSSISNLLYGKSPFYYSKARLIEERIGIPHGWLDQSDWIDNGWNLIKRYRRMNHIEKAFFDETVTFMQSRQRGALSRLTNNSN